MYVNKFADDLRQSESFDLAATKQLELNSLLSYLSLSVTLFHSMANQMFANKVNSNNKNI